MAEHDPARFGARLLPYEGALPTIHETSFVAAGVTLVGDIRLHEHTGIWYNTVMRGDVCRIEIGAYTNIQDDCMVHGPHGGTLTHIGREVTVGHKATLHGCTIEDRCLIGIGATLLDHSYIESESMVAAGAVVTPRTRVKRHTLYGGIPAKPIRELTREEIDYLAESARNYAEYARKAMAALSG